MHTMKTFLQIFGLMMALATAQAGTITISSVGGAKFATKSGNLLPAGCAVRVGAFLLPEATRDAVLTSQGDYAWLKSVFTPLAEGLIGAGTTTQMAGSGTVLRANEFPAAGEIFGSIENINPAYMPPGTRLYVWVFNHADPDQATEWGLFTSTQWVAPPALGNTTLTTTSVVAALQGESAGGKLKLIDVPATYGNWAWQSFSINAPSSVTGNLADPDGDGVQNIAEYAWRLNPAARSEPRTELTKQTGGTVTFRYKRPRNLPGVSVVAECSADLVTWQPAPSVVTGSDAEFDTLESTASTAAPCFWRVRFETTP